MSLMLNLPNVLREKADRPGGLLPEEAIEQARLALVAFRDTYSDWLGEDMKRLKAEADGAHAEPERRAARIDALYRIAHEMRGQAATFGQPLVTEIGNYLCHFVEGMGVPGERELEILDLHVDAIRMVVVENGAPCGPATAHMLVGLRAIATGEAGTRKMA